MSWETGYIFRPMLVQLRMYSNIVRCEVKNRKVCRYLNMGEILIQFIQGCGSSQLWLQVYYQEWRNAFYFGGSDYTFVPLRAKKAGRVLHCQAETWTATGIQMSQRARLQVFQAVPTYHDMVYCNISGKIFHNSLHCLYSGLLWSTLNICIGPEK